MSAVTDPATPANAVGPMVTMAEIEARFNQEWVLLQDPETTPGPGEIRSGTLLYHSPNRDELYRKALELRPKHSAIFYVGEPPDDLVFVL